MIFKLLRLLAMLGFVLAMLGWVVKKIWEYRWTRRTGRPVNELWDTPPPGGWPNDPINVNNRRMAQEAKARQERWNEARKKNPGLPEHPPCEISPAAPPRVLTPGEQKELEIAIKRNQEAHRKKQEYEALQARHPILFGDVSWKRIRRTIAPKLRP